MFEHQDASANEPRSARPPDLIVPLDVADVKKLQVSWWETLRPAELLEHVRRYPRLAWRADGWRDYVVGGHWRGRRDVGLLVQLGGRRYRVALLSHLFAVYHAEGTRAVVLSESEKENDLGWYLKNGWRLFEEIAVYERSHCRPLSLDRGGLLIRPYQPEDLSALIAVDHAAFPWLWWNDSEDFRQYLVESDVWCFVSVAESQLTGYVSFTVRGGSGHLDRLAVDPRFQSRGCGARLLSLAVDSMAYHGAKKIALTTQANNLRARALYERYDFHRARRTEKIYGIWLAGGDDLARR